MISWKVIIFYLFLIDAIGANLFAWTSGKMWYQKHFRLLTRYFPMVKGWTTYYLIWVVFVGWLLNSQGFFGGL